VALLATALGAVLAFYLTFVVALVATGRREDARALAGFVPDCAVMVARLLQDPAVPRRHKLLLALLAGYLALPLDLVPDFIPVAGQLDDAIVVAVVLRTVLRRSGAPLLQRHWPGPEASLVLMLRLAGMAPASRQAEPSP
jgi:uncharacterized membrane protein YkvA (DUF1232 family)